MLETEIHLFRYSVIPYSAFYKLPKVAWKYLVFFSFKAKNDVNKLKSSLDRQQSCRPPPTKKVKTEEKVVIVDLAKRSDYYQLYLCPYRKMGSAWLELENKQILLEGECLNDRHINYAQTS